MLKSIILAGATAGAIFTASAGLFATTAEAHPWNMRWHRHWHGHWHHCVWKRHHHHVWRVCR